MWGSPAPVQTEAEEVEGLKQMFAQPASPGGTQMGLGTYMKLSVANENRRIADKGREEKRELAAEWCARSFAIPLPVPPGVASLPHA